MNFSGKAGCAYTWDHKTRANGLEARKAEFNVGMEAGCCVHNPHWVDRQNHEG